jgi:thiamine biosynthesis protein ThiS
MQLVVNGEAREVAGAPTLGAFLAVRGLNPRMVVVERNGEIVPRPRYDDTPLAEGDTLEIVQMMAGG